MSSGWWIYGKLKKKVLEADGQQEKESSALNLKPLLDIHEEI